MSMRDDLKAAGKKSRGRLSYIGFALAALLAFFFITDQDGSLAKYRNIALPGIAVYVAFMAYGLVKTNRNDMMRGIEKFCSESANPEATMERLEKVWSDGHNFLSGRMDKDYIILLIARGLTSYVYPLKNVVRAYKYISYNGAVKTASLCLVFDNGKEEDNQLGEAMVDTVLGHLWTDNPDIAIGNEKEAIRLHKNKDIDGLRAYARQQRESGKKP